MCKIRWPFRPLRQNHDGHATNFAGIVFSVDDSRELLQQTPITPANHADMLVVAKQNGATDATAPVHDADSLVAGDRVLAFWERIQAWSQVKQTEASIRWSQNSANQASIIAALKATQRGIDEAREAAEAAQAREDEYRRETLDALGPAATARAARETKWQPRKVSATLFLSFAGEIGINVAALKQMAIGTFESSAIALTLSLIVFIFAHKTAHAFQERRWWLAATMTTLLTGLLLPITLMFTTLRIATLNAGQEDASGAQTSASLSDYGNLLFAGMLTIQLIFPLAAGLTAYLDHPVTNTLRDRTLATKKALQKVEAMQKAHPDLVERIEAAQERRSQCAFLMQQEHALITLMAGDAQTAYVQAFLQAAADPEVTSAMEQRLEAFTHGTRSGTEAASLGATAPQTASDTYQ